jgi:hypothetical protein
MSSRVSSVTGPWGGAWEGAAWLSSSRPTAQLCSLHPPPSIYGCRGWQKMERTSG